MFVESESGCATKYMNILQIFKKNPREAGNNISHFTFHISHLKRLHSSHFHRFLLLLLRNYGLKFFAEFLHLLLELPEVFPFGDFEREVER